MIFDEFCGGSDLCVLCFKVYELLMKLREEAGRQEELGRDTHIDYSILAMDATEIAKNLFLGDAKCAANLSLLNGLGITHIVVAGEELSPQFPKSFNYLCLPLKDSPREDIRAHFEGVSEFIGKALAQKEGVLVHCAFGVSRSATLVIAFLMRRLHIGYLDALSFVRRKRPVVKPNAGFEQQLRAWENQ